MKKETRYSKRSKILKQQGDKCGNCGHQEDLLTLDVHHKFYLKDKLMWEYPDDALVALCRSCHSKAHYKDDVQIPMAYYDSIFDYAHETYKDQKARRLWQY